MWFVCSLHYKALTVSCWKLAAFQHKGGCFVLKEDSNMAVSKSSAITYLQSECCWVTRDPFWERVKYERLKIILETSALTKSWGLLLGPLLQSLCLTVEQQNKTQKALQKAQAENRGNSQGICYMYKPTERILTPSSHVPRRLSLVKC